MGWGDGVMEDGVMEWWESQYSSKTPALRFEIMPVPRTRQNSEPGSGVLNLFPRQQGPNFRLFRIFDISVVAAVIAQSLYIVRTIRKAIFP
ncbi:MAG TPA: hypothetical protein VG146_10565, partial [Verrucomicrobiae bacterium]|nr:hypothetical protein [Verrucomicrobiae bacterium]